MQTTELYEVWIGEESFTINDIQDLINKVKESFDEYTNVTATYNKRKGITVTFTTDNPGSWWGFEPVEPGPYEVTETFPVFRVPA